MGSSKPSVADAIVRATGSFGGKTESIPIHEDPTAPVRPQPPHPRLHPHRTAHRHRDHRGALGRHLPRGESLDAQRSDERRDAERAAGRDGALELRRRLRRNLPSRRRSRNGGGILELERNLPQSLHRLHRLRARLRRRRQRLGTPGRWPHRRGERSPRAGRESLGLHGRRTEVPRSGGVENPIRPRFAFPSPRHFC